MQQGLAQAALVIQGLAIAPLILSMNPGPLWAEPSNHSSVELEAWVLAADPGLEAILEEVQATQAEAESARVAWHDPMLMVSGTVDAFGSHTPGAVRGMVEVAQAMPWFGVREAQAQPAEARAAARQAEAQTLTLTLIHELRSDLLALSRMQALRALLEDEQALWQESLTYAVDLLAFSTEAATAILELEMRLLELANEGDALVAEIAAVQARLSQRLRRAWSDGHTLTADDPLFRLIEHLDETSIYAGLAHHPRLLAGTYSQQSFAATAAAVEIARKPSLTFSLGVGAMPMETGSVATMVRLGVGLPLPLWNASSDALAASARSRADAAGHGVENTRRTLQAETESTIASYHAAHSQLQRLKSQLLPLANAYLLARQEDLALGRTTYGEVVAAQRQVLALRRAMVDARFDALLRQVDLDSLCAGCLALGRTSHD